MTAAHRSPSRVTPFSLRLTALVLVWLTLWPTLGLAQESDKPLPADEAARTMLVPEGFQTALFAGEPDVVQPIAMTTDDRGRVWVAECLSYPKWEETGKDRIVILTDTDGDGRSDKRQVFADNLANVSGVQIGFGGVYVMATPYLLFIPDADENDAPDGPAVQLLDGWDLKAKHNVASALTWGPDGWLYGANGILSNSFPAKPGTPQDQRTLFNCGVWRYHPTRGTFEPFSWGTTNPWGIDFDEYGQLFATNCVIAHLWHMVPGAHYQRMFGQDVNPNTYSLLPTIAEHLHWGGGAWQESRTGKVHDDAGGGHAHSGAMIYLGDNWPESYRGGTFMCNIHGRRVNHNLLVRSPVGYIGRRAPDVIRSQDPWFRGTAVMYGHDGGVYVADWSDAGECHDYEDIHRDNGRIFKVTYGASQAGPVDLKSLSDLQLLDLQTHKNEWYVRHARRRIHERIAAGTFSAEARAELDRRVSTTRDPVPLLRYVWCHFETPQRLKVASSLLADANENVRAWAIRLLLDDRTTPADAKQLGAIVDRATTETSPFVRLALASALQRLPAEDAWKVADRLANLSSGIDQPWVNHLLWYGIEPLVAAQPARAMATFSRANAAFIRECVARRLETDPAVIRTLAQSDQAEVQRSILRGLTSALEGRREIKSPAGWGDIAARLSDAKDEEIADLTISLSLQFGDEAAIARLVKLAENGSAPAAKRRAAVQSLALLKRDALKSSFLRWLAVPELRGACLPALSVFDDPGIGPAILARYSALTAEEKLEAVAILASRPGWAMSLFDELDAKRVARSDISLTVARQLANSKDEAVRERLVKSWGQVRDTASQRRDLIVKYRSELTPDVLAQADLSRGKALFGKTCATCHVLHGEGQKIGPELTGAQRTSLDYLLENVLDPSAVVATDYMNWLIETKDGRSLAGMITRETATTITVQLPNGQTIIPMEDIETRARLGTSLMPEGLIDPLSISEVRDLLGFIMKP